MESPTNGWKLYHEVQESSKLCAVHCLNTVLQGPFFSEADLAAIASNLGRTETRLMNQKGSELLGNSSTSNSHNVSTSGDFSIQVLEGALGVWNLHVIPLNSLAVEALKHNPELENAFICNSRDHCFCIRKVNGEWYNFNSLYAAPEHLSKLCLSNFLDTLQDSGWSIFLVRGTFPAECPITSSNSFGQWFTPEEAQKTTKSAHETMASQRKQGLVHDSHSSRLINERNKELAALLALDEDELIAAAADLFMAVMNKMGGVTNKATESSSDLVSPEEDSCDTDDSMDEAERMTDHELALCLCGGTTTDTVDILQGTETSAGSSSVSLESGVINSIAGDDMTDSSVTSSTVLIEGKNNFESDSCLSTGAGDNQNKRTSAGFPEARS